MAGGAGEAWGHRGAPRCPGPPRGCLPAGSGGAAPRCRGRAGSGSALPTGVTPVPRAPHAPRPRSLSARPRSPLPPARPGPAPAPAPPRRPPLPGTAAPARPPRTSPVPAPFHGSRRDWSRPPPPPQRGADRRWEDAAARRGLRRGAVGSGTPGAHPWSRLAAPREEGPGHSAEPPPPPAMTSLFRRSSSGGSSAQELNNSRPARQVRRLEFNQAMEDFKTMFPSMDYDIIECVLRANNGAVDATIDQLLQMNLDGSGCDDSSDSEDSIPPEILERTLEPDSSDEEPPPVYSPPAYESQALGSRYPRAPPTPPPRTDVPGPGSTGHYRNWNPPLLGNLPEDFLRILPQQTASTQGSQGCRQSVRGQGSLEQERRWKQYLEDERIALFLQNEEFMKELQRNRDFLLALERDRLKYESKKSKSTSVAVSNDFGFSSVLSGDVAASVPSEAGGAVSDDALFRDKLKHMGKSTRKKLFELARAFSEKTKMRKSKRKHLLKHQVMGTAASTANLLDDVEGHAYDEDFQARRQQLREEEEPKEGQ
ncbi:CUE domain-containing protein 1 [Oenanthe melanoleuca]|uniref:CUE domain-containing protein 1 n=1 Tax=Oenanthe melanoleuca TaxID=2939378 RepID=UPI0024C1ACB2|nr:CUE domain-containing protein 1 [Oenanthe melanoleuca]